MRPFTAQKMKFSTKDFFSKCDHTFTEEILNGKLHFLCSVSKNKAQSEFVKTKIPV